METSEEALLLSTQHDNHTTTSSSSRRRRRPGRQFPVFQMIIPAVLLLLSWSAAKDLMSHKRWLYMLAGVLAVNVTVFSAVIVVAIRQRRRKRRERSKQHKAEEAGPRANAALQGLWPALVLFLVYATPSSSTQVTSWYYAVWASRPCYTQGINITSSCSRLVGSWLYFKLFGASKGRRLVAVLVGSSVAAALLQMAYVPLVDNTIAPRNTPRLAYSCAATLVTGAVGQVAMLAFLTVAARACIDPARQGGGMIYAIVLSFLDFGDSVSGWITTPIADALNITFTDYSRVPDLIYIDSGTSIAIAPVMLLLLLSPGLYLSATNDSGSCEEGQGQGQGRGRGRGEAEAAVQAEQGHSINSLSVQQQPGRRDEERKAGIDQSGRH